MTESAESAVPSPAVLHVDIDAFFASVEQLRDPRLKGRPVAVGAGVIASCSYEARRFGLHAGMPLEEARRRCPRLVIVGGHYPIYRCFAEEVFARCREFSPTVEVHLDEAFCDFSGMERLYHSPLPSPPSRQVVPGCSEWTRAPTPGAPGSAELYHSPLPSPPSRQVVPGCSEWTRAPSPAATGSADDALLRAAVRLQACIRAEVGLSVSAGVGPNRMLAKIASKNAKPGGVLRVLPADVDAFIRDLPVRRLPGVGPRTEAVLRKLNIETIGALRLLSRASLEAMFGRPGADLYERCRGRDTRVIAAREIPRSISRETSFHQETIDRREIEAMLYYLCERAGNTLRQLGLLARTVEVKIRTVDLRGEEGSTTLRSPTAIDGEIFAAALARYRALHRRRVALRLIGVALTGLRPDSGFIPLDLFEEDGPPPADPHEDLLERAGRGARRRARAGRLCESLDAIRARFGYAAVVSGRSIHLLGKLPRDAYGFVLRTPCLTR